MWACYICLEVWYIVFWALLLSILLCFLFPSNKSYKVTFVTFNPASSCHQLCTHNCRLVNLFTLLWKKYKYYSNLFIAIFILLVQVQHFFVIFSGISHGSLASLSQNIMTYGTILIDNIILSIITVWTMCKALSNTAVLAFQVLLKIQVILKINKYQSLKMVFKLYILKHSTRCRFLLVSLMIIFLYLIVIILLSGVENAVFKVTDPGNYKKYL